MNPLSNLPSSDKRPGFPHLLPALTVGLGCALLYAAVAQGAIQGILVGYVPTLLLFGLGWLRGSRAAGLAAIAATMALLIFVPNAAMQYVALNALPTLLVLRLSLTYFAISGPDNKILPHLLPAFTTGQILTALCLYVASMLLVAIAALSMGSGTLNLPEPSSIMLEVAKFVTPRMSGENIPSPEILATQLLPLMPWLLGIGLWLWVIAMWVVAALSHFMAGSLGIPAPRDLALRPFRVPVWLLGALAVVGVGAAGAVGWIAIALKSTFFLLLFPYFLSGVAIILPKMPAGPARRWGIAGLVLGLAFFPWAALIFIAIGLFHPLQSRSSNS